MLFRDVLMLAASQGSAAAYAAYALALDFDDSVYRSGSTLTNDITTLPGYTYTRSGAKSEVAPTGTIHPFAANVPGIASGAGHWSRASMTNIALQSQSFDNATWIKTGFTVSPNVQVAPDGTTTMDTLFETAVTSNHNLQQDNLSVTLGNTYTYAAIAKDNGRIFQIAFQTGFGAKRANFNLATGAVGSFDTATATITPMGGGIYLCVATAVATATTAVGNINVLTVTAPTSVFAESFLGDVTKGVHLWQAQLYLGNFPDGGPVIVTTTAAATVGTDALSVSVANGTYSAVYTFDDYSTQTISTVIAAGAFSMPVHPTTLNRSLVRLVTLSA